MENHIKNKPDSKPLNIAFIAFIDKNNDLSNHYEALKIESQNNINPNQKINPFHDINTYNNNINPANNNVKIKVLIWNARSLNSFIKKSFIIDILRIEKPELAIISETFLLDEDNFYAKGYKTYKTRNICRRKGCCILISKNILASIITLKNDIEGRYIKVSAKSKDNDTPMTISSLYLEPGGDINTIPEELFDSDIIAGDLNKAETGLNKDGVYQFKGIVNIQTIKINNKISDHDIKIGQATIRLKINERYSKIEVNDKIIVEENDNSLKNIIEKEPNFKNPKKIIIKDNYEMTISDLSKYEDFQNLKEIFNSEFKDKYHNIEKLIRAGNITKNGWYKINKLFDEKKRKEIYSKDNQFSEIIDFYKKLYESNPKRNSLTHNDLKQKICDIIDLVDMHTNTNEISIWPPKSEAKDYYGFSQKTIEATIRGNTLKEELSQITRNF